MRARGGTGRRARGIGGKRARGLIGGSLTEASRTVSQNSLKVESVAFQREKRTYPNNRKAELKITQSILIKFPRHLC